MGITAVCAGLATRDVPATADRPSAWKGRRFREALPVPCGAAHEVGGWWRREHIRMCRNQLPAENPPCHHTGSKIPEGRRFLLPETYLIMGPTRLSFPPCSECFGGIHWNSCNWGAQAYNSTTEVSSSGGRPRPTRIPVHPGSWEPEVLMPAKTA